MQITSQKTTEISSSICSELHTIDIQSVGKVSELLKELGLNVLSAKVKVSKSVIDYLLVMYKQIGAMSEIPQDIKDRQMYLTDLYHNLYLRNNLIPRDIPFDVLIEEFVQANYRGEATRKGNNPVAIIQSVRQWIITEQARINLYQARDSKYSSKKPKQLAEVSKKPITFDEYSDAVLLQKIKHVELVAFTESGKALLEELTKEKQKRGLK